MWTNSGAGRDSLLLLAIDATPAGYGKQRRQGHGGPSTANKHTAGARLKGCIMLVPLSNFARFLIL